jgi:hypothetical protein
MQKKPFLKTKKLNSAHFFCKHLLVVFVYCYYKLFD